MNRSYVNGEQMLHTVSLLSKFATAAFDNTGILRNTKMLPKMSFEGVLASKGLHALQTFIASARV